MNQLLIKVHYKPQPDRRIDRETETGIHRTVKHKVWPSCRHKAEWHFIALLQGSDDYIVTHKPDYNDIVFFLFKNSLGTNKKKVQL